MRSKHGPFWTKERRDILRTKWGKIPAREIALMLECTANAVIGKANRMHLPPVTRQKAGVFAWETMAARGTHWKSQGWKV